MEIFLCSNGEFGDFVPREEIAGGVEVCDLFENRLESPSTARRLCRELLLVCSCCQSSDDECVHNMSDRDTV
jgi:hypothetical protein